MIKNYIINLPERHNGIYAILNIVEKKVYVGLAHDMLRRTNEHFIAISNFTIGNDNQYLLNEENKQFLHFPIYKKQEEINNLPDLESDYMAVFKYSLGFELYNIAKEKKVELHDEKKYLKQVESSFKKLVGESLIEISRLSKAEREIKWNSIVKKFDKSDRETICLESETGDFSKSNKYEYVIRKMATLVISKSILRKDLKINWPEKSIKDQDLYRDGAIIISNFGSHNGETPYEIIKKMDMDLQMSSDGCAYWALKNVNEETFREKCNDNKPVYVIFKTTTSDNSGGTKVKLDVIATEESIREKGQKLKEKNDPTLMQSYKDVENNWHSLPQEITGVSSQTSAWREGSGYKVVAFRIKKFYICKEDFSVTELKKWIKQKTGQQNTYDLKVKEEDFDNIEFINDSDSTECLIAELQYPYVVIVNNAPGLKQYLRGWYNGESNPRLMFESKDKFEFKDNKKNRDVTRVFMFCTEEGNRTVYVRDVESRKIDTIPYKDKDLEWGILEGGEKCSYEVIIDEKTETIKINGSSIKENISFKRKYDAENVSFIKHKDIKYQCLQDSNSGLFYTFRGFEDNKGTPIFVFDEV